MFFVESKDSDGNYIVVDTVDNTRESCTKAHMKEFLDLGISVAGLTYRGISVMPEIKDMDLNPYEDLDIVYGLLGVLKTRNDTRLLFSLYGELQGTYMLHNNPTNEIIRKNAIKGIKDRGSILLLQELYPEIKRFLENLKCYNYEDIDGIISRYANRMNSNIDIDISFSEVVYLYINVCFRYAIKGVYGEPSEHTYRVYQRFFSDTLANIGFKFVNLLGVVMIYSYFCALGEITSQVVKSKKDFNILFKNSDSSFFKEVLRLSLTAPSNSVFKYKNLRRCMLYAKTENLLELLQKLPNNNEVINYIDNL